MEESNNGGYYRKEFYNQLNEGSSASAKIILDILYHVYKPKTVVDVGCGQGNWLAIAESLGSETLVGLDGPWVKKDDLRSDNIMFIPMDFQNELILNRTYDLCISLEVAEHIPSDRASWFIDSLCKASDVILFSAAIKFQGGIHHVNEQWQSYWIDLFQDNNYDCFDIIRGAVWHNKNVEWWYRQNTFLFMKSGAECIDINVLKSLEKPVLDVVHPAHYYSKVMK